MEDSTLASWWGFQPERGMVLRQIHEPLVDRDPVTNEFIPMLATGWEQLDDETWEFELRQGVTFHDGSPFDAEAAAFALNYLFSPENELQSWQRHRTEIEATVIGDSKIRVTTVGLVPLFLQWIYENGIPSMRQILEEPELYESVPIGTGAYKFVKWERGISIELAANEDWWGPSADDSPGQINFDTVIVLIRPEPRTRIAAVEADEMDVAWDVPFEECQAQLGASCITAPGDNVVNVRFDSQHPVMSDPRIKEAMALALDKEAIGLRLWGSPPIGSMDVPGAFGYNPDLEPWPYDPERAKALVEEARADGVPVDMELRVSGRAAFFASVEELTEIVHFSLQEIGLNVAFEMLETPEHVPLFIERAENLSPERNYLFVSRRGGGGAFDSRKFADTWYLSTGCCGVEPHADVDQIIQTINDSRDRAEQDRLLQELHRMFRYDMEKVFYIPITQLSKFHGVAAHLEWTPRPDSQMLFREIVVRP
jgi:peptide/nickel transport system substrate-binding protein